jgi:hypothetical protein
VREALHVVRHVLRELDDGRAETLLGADPARGKPLLDEIREDPLVDLAETYDRARLVERPARREHPLHQRRLGSREHVAHGPLFLHGGAKRVLDVAAVEGGDGLELVEGDGHPLAARRGDARRQREDLRRELRRVPRRPHCGKRDGKARLAGGLGVEPQLGAHRLEQAGRPAPQTPDGCLGGHERARVGLEEPDIGAGRRHGDLHREHPFRGKAFHDVADERRLAVPTRRNQEDLLTFRKVAPETQALAVAVGERRRGHHFAVDERIAGGHYGIIRNGYAKCSNAWERTSGSE